MPSLPPLSTHFFLEVNLYWLLAVFVAWTVLWGLIGYLIGYRQPKYIVVRDSDLAS